MAPANKAHLSEKRILNLSETVLILLLELRSVSEIYRKDTKVLTKIKMGENQDDFLVSYQCIINFCSISAPDTQTSFNI